RIGARDQLLTFARILGTPMHSAADARDLGRVLDGLSGKKLVLIDTAGMSQRDVRLAEQFATLRVDGANVRSVLVLSAATERGALDEALGVFRSADPKALVVTKIDEAALLGPILSLAIESRLPVVYVSDGQRVPEDLHVAASKRIWLMQRAVGRARSRPSQLSADELAARFGTSELAERFGEQELAGAELARSSRRPRDDRRADQGHRDHGRQGRRRQDQRRRESRHRALPALPPRAAARRGPRARERRRRARRARAAEPRARARGGVRPRGRSEEHTSEL